MYVFTEINLKKLMVLNKIELQLQKKRIDGTEGLLAARQVGSNWFK